MSKQATLQTLRSELGLPTTNEVKRVARDLDIQVGDVQKPLKSKDARRIRAEVVRRRSLEPEVALEPEAPATEATTTPLVKPPPRRVPGKVRDRGHKVFLHTDMLAWLEDPKVAERFKDKAHFVLRHLFAEGRTPKVKGLRGPGAGWKRSPLGGSGGMQWYLWWLQPGSKQADALKLGPRERIVRTVLHHDDNHQVPSTGTRADYVRMTAGELVNEPEAYGPGLSAPQAEVVGHTAPVRMVKGHPGSGKTTTLLAAVERLSGRRVLYLTYSDRLVSQAKNHFDVFAPKALEVNVLSMRGLLELWPGHSEGVRDPEAASLLLAESFATYHGGLGPWCGRIPELYGELHASMFGAALPFPFRGRKPASDARLDSGTYHALRAPTIGREAAGVVKKVTDRLDPDERLRLFPAPLRARAALDRVLGDGPLPEPLRDLDWIVVDEVQDLTLVEQALVVELAARTGSGANGRAGLLAAGDEGQTVRPTDFAWGPFNDLCAERLAPREEFELPGNVRCPPDIAAVINDSWQFYRLFERQERPRGRAEADLDGSSTGRIVRVVAEGPDDLAPLFDYFETNPDSELVYPGFAVPASLDDLAPEELIWTSRSVKGLDFRTVGVLDVGARLAEVADLASGTTRGKEFATQLCRNRVDQLRVAISRATDTLILIDIAPGKEAEALVGQLVASVKNRVIHADPEEARALLEQETLDPLDRLQSFVEDIRRMVEDQSGRAMRRAVVAQQLVHGMDVRHEEVPADIRAELAALTAQAALRHALTLHEQASMDDLPRVLAVAEEALRGCKAPTAARVTRGNVQALLTTAREEAALQTQAVLNVARSLPRIEAEVPDLAPLFRQTVLDWTGLVANDAPLPPTPGGRGRLADALKELGTLLEEHQGRIAGETQNLIRRTARHLMELSDWDGALRWWPSLVERDHAAEGLCHERLGALEAALAAYQTGKKHADALRCARAIPNWDVATRLLDGKVLGTPADRWSLQWANRLRRVLEERPGDSGAGRLTEAEHKALAQLLRRHPAMGRR